MGIHPTDKVLILLPTLSSKLLMEWIRQWVREVDYENKQMDIGSALPPQSPETVESGVSCVSGDGGSGDGEAGTRGKSKKCLFFFFS